MSDSPTDPNWNLLPHQPQAFFGLAQDFDRKDLKRSYNQLLRQFKPEKFPAEFQRIRAAYEYLDNQLRYGQQISTDRSATAYQWQTDSAQPAQRPADHSQAAPSQQAPLRPEAASGQAAERQHRDASNTPHTDTPSPRALPLHERIQQQPLVEVYRELAAKLGKSPYEYYALAMMSDVVDRRDDLQFANWLLLGLQKYPGDPGLGSLLYEYYRGPVPPAILISLLTATSRIVANDRFFSLTESLWKRLLHEVPFDTFKTTLQACTSNLRDLGIDARLAFFVELLKPAIWKADPEWIETTMNFIEENFERMPFHLRYEVDILSVLRKYALQRPQFLHDSPLRQQLDQAICDYYTQEQGAGDHGVLDFQVRIAQDPDAMLAAFPAENGEDHEYLYLIWQAITHDVWERNFDPSPARQDVSLWFSRADAVLRQIQEISQNSSIGHIWTLTNFGYSVGIVMLYIIVAFPVAILAIYLTMSVDGAIAVFAAVAAVAAVWFLTYWLQKRYISPAFLRYAQRQEHKFYNRLWRSEFAGFMHRSQLDFFEFRDLLYQCDLSQLPWSHRALVYFQRDYALAMFSAAQRFVV